MYLDPGFGSMIIQLLIASIAGIAVFFGMFRVKIKAFFKKGKQSAEQNTTEEGIDE